MKKILLIILIFFWLTQISTVYAWGGYLRSYSSEADIINAWKDDLTKRVHSNEFLKIDNYWKSSSLGNNEVTYQLWVWWIVKLNDINSLQLKFKNKFNWELIISNEDKNWKIEILKELEISNSSTEKISFRNVWTDSFMFFELIDWDNNILKISTAKWFSAREIIFNNSGISKFSAHYPKITELSWLETLSFSNLILESDIPESEFNSLIQLISERQVSILENTNTELLTYIFWNNFKDYKKSKTAKEYVWPRYNWIYKLQKGEHGDFFIERKYNVYKKWIIEIFVIDSDYLKENTNKWELMLNINNYINHNSYWYEDEINAWSKDIDYDNLIYRINFFIDSINEKYKTTWIIITLLVIYIILIISFYFLFSHKIKNRYAIIYYTGWLGLLLFIIYYWLFTAQVWTKDIIQNVQMNFHYNNFTISKITSSHFWVNTGNHTFNLKYDTNKQSISKRENSNNFREYSHRFEYKINNEISQISDNQDIINVTYNIKPLRHTKNYFTLIDFSKTESKKWVNVLELSLESYIDSPVKVIINTLKNKKAQNVFLTKEESDFTKNFRVKNSENSVYIFDIY